MAMTLYQSQRMIESDQFVFHCVLKDARILICLLQTINLNEDLIVMFTEKGMQFTSEKNKVFQITGYLQRELFDEFTLREESIGLKLPIKLFMDCLTSTLTCSSNFDEQDDKENLVVKKPDTDEPNTSIEICYAGTGEPLLFSLKDDISVTECTLSPQSSDNIITFDLRNENIISRVIVQSDYLRETFNKLIGNGENLQISVDPEFGLVLTTTGAGVTSTHKISKDSTKLLNHEFSQLHSNAYKIKFIKLCMKALNQSTKTCIKIDTNGLLNIEYMVRTIGDQKCYVQTFCLPNVDSSI